MADTENSDSGDPRTHEQTKILKAEAALRHDATQKQQQTAPEQEQEQEQNRFAGMDGRVNKQAFFHALKRIPPDTLIKFAEDGVVCEGELAQLFQLMGLRREELEMMRQHMHTISHTVLRYAEQQLGAKAPAKGNYVVKGEQAVAIMQRLLNDGLIDKYFADICNSARVQPVDTGIDKDRPTPQKTR